MGVRSLGGGDPLEKGIATQLLPIRQYSCLENPQGQRSLGGATVLNVVHGRTGLKHTLRLGKGNLQRDRLTYDFFHHVLSS